MQKVVVVGLGRSGVAASRLLAKRGYDVFITDIKNDDALRLSLSPLVREGIVKKTNYEIGRHSADFVRDADLLVVSPGVKKDSVPIKAAMEEDIPIVSELELAYSMCPAPVIAVTGTSGKTTVTTLVRDMLKKGGIDAFLCGNIGNPFSGEIDKIRETSIAVLEVSSFQLEWVKTFKPELSIILNISENHLDRHKDMDEYISLKLKIFSNQDEKDTIFLNGKDRVLKNISENIKRPRVEFFDEYKDFRRRYNIENENYLAAMSIASMKGVNEEIMLEVISKFRGIEHRLEYVTTVNGVEFINDSKATTISSVEWALKSLNGRLILIMGGRYKGGDFSRLEVFLREKVTSVIAIGEARSKIKKALTMFKALYEEDSLADAVHKAFGMAHRGDKVLFSPGCSSFDMFKDYEERGNVFKELCSNVVESFRI